MAVSVEPVARYCKQLTVGRMQVLPSVDTIGQNAIVLRGWWCAAFQTPVKCHCQLQKHPVRDVKPVKIHRYDDCKMVVYVCLYCNAMQEHCTSEDVANSCEKNQLRG